MNGLPVVSYLLPRSLSPEPQLSPATGVQETSCAATGNWQRATWVATRYLAVSITLLATRTLLACPVCWGSPDEPMVKGVNNGIWVLLGLVGFVQIGFVALFWSFWRRARAQQRFRESLRVIEGGPHS
ncbi:MAG: hypothetical protein M3Q69_11100 [Acidobacteriota bacterium]|nr:hypothetical protein [Acidobacteriota bacterium]